MDKEMPILSYDDTLVNMLFPSRMFFTLYKLKQHPANIHELDSLPRNACATAEYTLACLCYID
jgi:hypothetical protein